MLPIYANCCRGVATGYSYGLFVTVDNLGISWHECHKKPNKISFHWFLVAEHRYSLKSQSPNPPLQSYYFNRMAQLPVKRVLPIVARQNNQALGLLIEPLRVLLA